MFVDPNGFEVGCNLVTSNFGLDAKKQTVVSFHTRLSEKSHWWLVKHGATPLYIIPGEHYKEDKLSQRGIAAPANDREGLLRCGYYLLNVPHEFFDADNVRDISRSTFRYEYVTEKSKVKTHLDRHTRQEGVHYIYAPEFEMIKAFLN
ncbi:hypothetical protein [Agrobacterium tumefaciens]|uniref:hypothetical protein n=1 Tax=Agrobacterium tumefaciens TaxID=358 RepID=UPI001573047B|nr:hypothetical protein [Agrobacterium tumefaciens]NTA44472.1 hypothetical protein [Agrobacterium tumefaciens]WIE34595.1 hypothetical protein G6L82_017410 [Agrobacterium tumefaciens]